MRYERGYSLVELLVASAVLMLVSGAVLGFLHDGLAATPVLEETTDLHQRARVATDALASELRAAAAGTPSGPLSRRFAAVEPRRASDPAGSVSAFALTVRYVPAGAAHSRLLQPLEPGVQVAIIEGVAGCPEGTTACGFVAGTTAVVFDTLGHADFVTIDAIGPGVLTLSDLSSGRATAYPAGSEIAEAFQITYSFDAAARQLRRAEGGGTFVVTDNLAGLTFEYFDDDMMPLPIAGFADGPFKGAGALAFDVDLLRIRTVRAALRLDTGVDSMRGVDPRLFARRGTATGPRVIADVVARLDVSLRNVGSLP